MASSSLLTNSTMPMSTEGQWHQHNASASSPSSLVPAQNPLAILDASIWMNIIRLGIAINTMGTNAFLLLLFQRHKKLRERLCNKLILLNAAMDFISGSAPGVRAIFQLYVHAESIVEFPKITCILLAFPYQFGYSGSQITFLGLAFDRLNAISRPLKYTGNNGTFAWFIGTLAVFFGIFCYSLDFIGNDLSPPARQCSVAINAGPYFSKYWTFFNTISTVIVFVTYVAILSLYFKHKSSPAKTAIYTIGQQQQPQQQQPQKAAVVAMSNKEINLTMAIALILLIYTLTWTVPVAIWLTFMLLDPTNMVRMNYMSYLQGYITAIGCGINLYIYLLRHSEIRRYAFRMLLCCGGGNRQTATSKITAADVTRNNGKPVARG